MINQINNLLLDPFYVTWTNGKNEHDNSSSSLFIFSSQFCLFLYNVSTTPGLIALVILCH
jgi:hypothetical protein